MNHKFFLCYNFIQFLLLVTCHVTSTSAATHPVGIHLQTLKTFQSHACEGEQLELLCPEGSVISILLGTASVLPSGREARLCKAGPTRSSSSGRKSSGGFDESKCFSPEISHKLTERLKEVCRAKGVCSLLVSGEELNTVLGRLEGGSKTIGGNSSSSSLAEWCRRAAIYVEVAYRCLPKHFVEAIACEGKQMDLFCPTADQRLVISGTAFGRNLPGVTPAEVSNYCPPPTPSALRDPVARYPPGAGGVTEMTCQASWGTETGMTICHGHRACALTADEKTFGALPCRSNTTNYSAPDTSSDDSPVVLHVTYACAHMSILKFLFNDTAVAATHSNSSVIDSNNVTAGQQTAINKTNYGDGRGEGGRQVDRNTNERREESEASHHGSSSAAGRGQRTRGRNKSNKSQPPASTSSASGSNSSSGSSGEEAEEDKLKSPPTTAPMNSNEMLNNSKSPSQGSDTSQLVTSPAEPPIGQIESTAASSSTTTASSTASTVGTTTTVNVPPMGDEFARSRGGAAYGLSESMVHRELGGVQVPPLPFGKPDSESRHDNVINFDSVPPSVGSSVERSDSQSADSSSGESGSQDLLRQVGLGWQSVAHGMGNVKNYIKENPEQAILYGLCSMALLLFIALLFVVSRIHVNKTSSAASSAETTTTAAVRKKSTSGSSSSSGRRGKSSNKEKDLMSYDTPPPRNSLSEEEDLDSQCRGGDSSHSSQHHPAQNHLRRVSVEMQVGSEAGYYGGTLRHSNTSGCLHNNQQQYNTYSASNSLYSSGGQNQSIPPPFGSHLGTIPNNTSAGLLYTTTTAQPLGSHNQAGLLSIQNTYNPNQHGGGVTLAMNPMGTYGNIHDPSGMTYVTTSLAGPQQLPPPTHSSPHHFTHSANLYDTNPNNVVNQLSSTIISTGSSGHLPPPPPPTGGANPGVSTFSPHSTMQRVNAHHQQQQGGHVAYAEIGGAPLMVGAAYHLYGTLPSGSSQEVSMDRAQQQQQTINVQCRHMSPDHQRVLTTCGLGGGSGQSHPEPKGILKRPSVVSSHSSGYSSTPPCSASSGSSHGGSEQPGSEPPPPPTASITPRAVSNFGISPSAAAEN